ncbi:MAG: sigma-70 family RNA polymerase sigma factor [Candidatus Eiseniibacteriota bacterium]|jgi:RNA polymerase sigma-70 factor (ECF subfamily)
MTSVPDRSACEPLGEASEQELVEAASAGDLRAFETLVRRYQERIHAVVARMVDDREVAEELTQDVFIRAYRSLHGFRHEARFSTWLHRIAANACLDYHGSRARREAREARSLDAADGEMGGLASRDPRPDEVLEGAELETHFMRCLESLDPIYRQAFVLRHQEDTSYEEIAAILDISISNAKVRVHRARETILSTMRALGHEV